MKHSLPLLENEREWSVNTFRSFIFTNMSSTSSQASINKDMAACIGKYVWDIPATYSRTVTT